MLYRRVELVNEAFEPQSEEGVWVEFTHMDNVKLLYSHRKE